ncbi:MAG: hypothetical protein IJO62_03950 [Clostridia bacterium]|nr:hypothetical protein [Clostridia bacterium]
MKKSSKLLAILLVCVITAVSFPAIQLAPKADEPASTTYTFNFDESDAYDFYDSDYVDPENPEVGSAFTPPYTPAPNFTYEAITTDGSGFTGITEFFGEQETYSIGRIGDVVAREEGVTLSKDDNLGDVAEYVSPDSRVFEETAAAGQYLTSGSFKVCLGQVGRFSPVWVFGQNAEEAYVLNFGIRQSSTCTLRYQEAVLTADSHKFDYSAMPSGTTSEKLENASDVWLQFNFYYDDEGYLNISFTTYNGNALTGFKSENPIPYNERAFAFSYRYHQGDVPYYFDDVSLTFEALPEIMYETFNFEGNDDYSFVNNAYEDLDYGNQNGTLVIADSDPAVTHQTTTLSDNSVLQLGTITANTDKTLTIGNLGEFISPDTAVYTEYASMERPRVFTCGSFLMNINARYGQRNTGNSIIIFGQKTEEGQKYYYFLGFTNYSNNLCFNIYKVAAGTETTAFGTVSNNQQPYLQITATIETVINSRIDFSYDADGHYNITVTDVYNTYDSSETPVTASFEYTDATFSPSERMLAFTYAKRGNDKVAYFDDVSLGFEECSHEAGDFVTTETKHGHKCNWCGAMISPEAHVFDGYVCDANGHTVACSVCDYEKEDTTASHTPNIQDPDAFITQYCTTCNYVMKEADTYFNDFEDAETDKLVAEDAWNVHVHENVTAEHSIVNNYDVGTTNSTFVPAKGGENNVGKIALPVAKTDKTATNYNMSEFYSPAKSVFDGYAANSKYLASGSFDISVGRVGRFSTNVVFGIDSTNYYLVNFTVRSSGCYLLISSTAFPKDTENTVAVAMGTHISVLAALANATTYGSDKWLHCEFIYDAENQLHLVLSDDSGVDQMLATGVYIAPENRIFAFTNSYYNGANPTYFDNLALNFAETQTVVIDTVDTVITTPNTDAMSFYEDLGVSNASSLTPANTVPYDFTKFSPELTNYKAIKGNVNLKYNTPLLNTLDGVIARQADWGDTSTPQKEADSFINLYGESLNANAYNIFRRLSKEARAYVKSAYADEYNTMLTAVETTNTADDSTLIGLYGDNVLNSAASGLGSLDAAYTVESYYTQNNDYSFEKLLHSTSSDALSRQFLQNNYARYYQTVINFTPWTSEQDVVFIMLGNFDIMRNGTNGLNADYQNIKSAYTDLVNKFLSNPNNPEVVLCTLPSYKPLDEPTGTAVNAKNNYEAAHAVYSEAIKAVADEYGLSIFDVEALSADWDDSYFVNSNSYFTCWHLSDTGATALSTAMLDYIENGVANYSNENGCDYDFEYSATYSPKLLGASISDAAALTEAGTRDIYFRYSLPTDLPEGIEISDHGVIATYSQYLGKYVTEKEDLSLLNAYQSLDSDPEFMSDYVIKVQGENEPQADGNYAAAVSVPSRYYGVRVIARAYVVLNDGRVYYSYVDAENALGEQTADGLSGVAGGYAIRSISGITMNIARFIVQNGEEGNLTPLGERGMTDYVNIVDYKIIGWSDTYQAELANGTNGDEFIVFIASNKNNIATIYSDYLESSMPATIDDDTNFGSDFYN